MNYKRYIIASIAILVTSVLSDYAIHEMILHEAYETLENVLRPDLMSKWWVLLITSIIFSFVFVYIFTKGYENKGITEGIRYGIIIGFLMNAVGTFSEYAVFPIPLSLAVQWFVYGMIQFSIYGIIAAVIYKPKTTS